MNSPKTGKTCPVCGSTNIQVSDVERVVDIPLGSSMKFMAVLDKCLDCETEVDFLKINEPKVQSILNQANAATMKILINSLADKSSLSMALIERVFELPSRTMMRWKNGDFSAGALALVRLLFTFPWLAKVAEARFDRNFSDVQLALEGVKATSRLTERLNFSKTFIAQTKTDDSQIAGIFAIKKNNQSEEISLPSSDRNAQFQLEVTPQV